MSEKLSTQAYGQTPTEQAVIAHMKALHQAGLSVHGIARQLDTEGAPTRTGGPWSTSTIGQALKREGICTTFSESRVPVTAAPVPDASSTTDVIVLALLGCEGCNGLGRRETGIICPCVHRKVCRMVMAKFRYIHLGYHHAPPIPIDYFISGGGKKKGYRLMQEEFAGDVHLTAKRTLMPSDFQLFRFYYYLGADAATCAKRLGMDRGAFLQRLGRVEAKLGHVFRTLTPYALYPIDDYFQRRVPGGARPCLPRSPDPGPRGPLRPPMADGRGRQQHGNGV